jgi:hypothetical protein
MDCTDITLTFRDEAAASRGLELLRDMIKAYYAARKGGILPEEPDKTRVLCELFFRCRPQPRRLPFFPGRRSPFSGHPSIAA